LTLVFGRSAFKASSFLARLLAMVPRLAVSIAKLTFASGAEETKAVSFKPGSKLTLFTTKAPSGIVLFSAILSTNASLTSFPVGVNTQSPHSTPKIIATSFIYAGEVGAGVGQQVGDDVGLAVGSPVGSLDGSRVGLALG
jgi:hypothetical protein